MNSGGKSILVNRGFLVLVIALLMKAIFAYYRHWGFWVGFAVLLGGIGVVWWMRRREKARVQAALDIAFAMFEGSMPELKQQMMYAFPAFTVTFRSKEDMNEAEASGRMTAFKASIMELYRDAGPKSNPFDADKAVYATYAGRVYPVAGSV